MKDDTTITALHQPGAILDPLTEIARDGARRMLMAALKAEAARFVAKLGEERLPDGRQRVVLHGAGPERTIQTGISARSRCARNVSTTLSQRLLDFKPGFVRLALAG